jgi:hypothetical protein
MVFPLYPTMATDQFAAYLKEYANFTNEESYSFAESYVRDLFWTYGFRNTSRRFAAMNTEDDVSKTSILAASSRRTSSGRGESVLHHRQRMLLNSKETWQLTGRKIRNQRVHVLPRYPLLGQDYKDNRNNCQN